MWYLMKTHVLLIVFLIFVISCANAEVLSFCNSVPMQVAPWAYNASFPKFDSSMGELKSVELRAEYNVTQDYKAENKGASNATLNSSMDMLLQIETPDGSKLASNISRILVKELAPFDGAIDYSGSSGLDLNESSSSGVVVWDDISTIGFLANASNEDVVLRLSSEDLGSFNITGALNLESKVMAGARVCVYYDYNQILREK